MGAEDFKPQNEFADKLETSQYKESMVKLEELKGIDYPNDFKKDLKAKDPDLYERVQGLNDKSSVMELGMAIDDLDAALSKFDAGGDKIKVETTEAPIEKPKPKMTRERFMEKNKDLDLKQFYTLDGQTMKIDFKGNRTAERFVQIQDIMKDPAKNKTVQLEKKSVVYTWNEKKNPPSFYSGDYRMQIVTGDEIKITDVKDESVETPENAKMRESLAAKFGVDASKLTNMKMDTSGGEAKATYNYEQNGQQYQLQFNTGKNTVTIMDKDGKVLDGATAGKSKDETGNIQVAMMIEDMQKDQGIDTKGVIAKTGTEIGGRGVEMNANAIKTKFNLKENPTHISDGGPLFGGEGVVKFEYRGKIVVVAPNGVTGVLDNLKLIGGEVTPNESKNGTQTVVTQTSFDVNELDKGESIDSIVDEMIKKNMETKKTAGA